MGIAGDTIIRLISITFRLLKKPFIFFMFKLGGYWLLLIDIFVGIFPSDSKIHEMREAFLCLGCLIIFYHIIRLFIRRRIPGWGIFPAIIHKSSNKKENKILDPDIPEALHHKEKTGVFFGEKNGKYVCQPESLDGHCLVLGGPGSGKSTSVAIPTVRNWNGPMFVIDIKQELERIGISNEQKSRTKIFNPTLEWGTVGFDPFYLAKNRNKQSEVLQDINDIAWAIIPESTAKDPYWDNSARDLLIGVLLYGFRVKKFEFIDCFEWLADHSSREIINEICACSDVDCRRQVLEFKDAPDNTLGSIWATLGRPIKLFYQDEMIKNALRKGGMSPADLEEGYNIICQIPEAKLEQWKSLLTLMVNQFLKFFELRDETKTLKPILLLIDETPRMGKLRIKDALATLRSKKIHIVLCAQGLSQFRGIYGKDDTDTIMANCGYKAILSATDSDSQKWLSSLCGKYDKTMKSTSTNKKDLDPFGGSGTSYSEQLRDIIPPETFGELPNTGQLILFNPHNRYCRVNKVPWYSDPKWDKQEGVN